MYGPDDLSIANAIPSNGTDVVLVVALCRPVMMTCEVPNNMTCYSTVCNADTIPCDPFVPR